MIESLILIKSPLQLFLSTFICLFMMFLMEIGADRRTEWMQTCLQPIISALYSHSTSHSNIFNYILPSLIILKPNMLSSSLKAEQKQFQLRSSSSSSSLSLFEMDLFFLNAAREGTDETMNALLTLAVLRIDKERGIIGKQCGDYLISSSSTTSTTDNSKDENDGRKKEEEERREKRFVEMDNALAWSACGSDEIRIKLMELVTNTLYVGTQNGH